MRILLVHNRYLQRGGEDVSCEAEADLLRDHNHEVMQYEVSNERIASLGKLRAAARTIWSSESYRRVEELIRSHQPDIMHVQNFFPLISPSVYYAACKHRVPVVQSLRNYRLICLGGQLLRQGRVCEDCIGKRTPWPGVRHACYRNSHTISAVTGAMLMGHRIAGTWFEKVTCYLALSEFSRQKFIEAGFPETQVVVKPNFLKEDPGMGEERRNGAVCVGRLSPEKGVATLIEAWKQAGIHEPLRIIGEGPEAEALTEQARDCPSIQWMGALPSQDVFAHVKASRYLVFPSKCYETFGRTILEAFATGTPVIASRLGAAAELVEHNVNGWLYEPGDVDDLSRAIRCAHDEPNHLKTMGARGRKSYEDRYTAARNYARIMQIYEQVHDG